MTHALTRPYYKMAVRLNLEKLGVTVPNGIHPYYSVMELCWKAGQEPTECAALIVRLIGILKKG